MYLVSLLKNQYPRPSVTAFCVRFHEGELVFSKWVRIPDSTNLFAEAIAIREDL